MQYKIHQEPEQVFHFFEIISAIPRGSGNEKGIADYLVSFAKERNLFCVRDEWNNVFIRRPGKGKGESSPALAFQGHVDMVCEKLSTVAHDFEKEGIDLVLGEDGWLRANGTTLGGDDGIAVAMMLAMLDGNLPDSYPPLEILFTTNEEVGLTGATGFDYRLLTADRLINLDSEEESFICVGCAGGVRTDLRVQKTKDPEPFTGKAVSVQIRKLMGGHSGNEINSNRTNAIKLMGRLLSGLQKDMPFRLLSIDGGLKDNAIPRECEAVLSGADAEGAKAQLKKLSEAVLFELRQPLSSDQDVEIQIQDAKADTKPWSGEITRQIIAFISGIQNGVLCMSRQIPNLVEFSRNFGIIRTEKEQIVMSFSTRSAIETQLDASMSELESIALCMGWKVKHRGRYPGWAFKEDSVVRAKYIAKCKELLGTDVGFGVIHAGLECGLISGKKPGMDMISVGPDMKNIHTPEEALSLSSCARIWTVLQSLILDACDWKTGGKN